MNAGLKTSRTRSTDSLFALPSVKTCTRRIVELLLCSTIVLIAAAGERAAGASGDTQRASERTAGALERTFTDLPIEARRLTGPLFWLHGDESPERLQMYVDKVLEGGNGCFTAESRPHSDWLGPGWFDDLEICLDAAKMKNLQMWIFDEKWWPSGEVGGNVPEKYASKTMIAEAKPVAGPTDFADEGYAGDRYIAAVAGRKTPDGIDPESLIDLTPHVADGRLRWHAPAGDWQVMKFTWEPYRHGSYQSRNFLVDGASRDCVDWYIQTVYQPHYDHFRKDFGTAIPGFFYDEPETRGDWGTEVLPMLTERGVDWKKALVAWKFQLAGEQHAAANYQYRFAFAEAWGRTLFGGITDWCRAHDVLSIGHFLEHNWEYLHPQLCAGDMFQLQKYSDMGGIDAVFAQFVQGERDPGLWQTPKLGSSITHVYDKPDDITMVEIYGARGQDVTYPEMKWWADLMHVAGVNFFIPHSFNPRSPYDRDCPPYFYNGGYEPRWPLYRILADYTSRLSVMLTGGRHVCPVALLYLGQSRHVGRSITPEQMSTALQDALYDCDWMPWEVFEDDTRLDGNRIRLHDEEYRILIVPPVEVIPYESLVRARRFYDGGGIVVGYGFLPTLSATLGRDSADIAGVREALWGDAEPGLDVCKTNARGGRSYLLPAEPTPEQLQQVLAEDAGVRPTLEVLEGETDHWLHVLHRIKDGRDVFFITNQKIDGDAKTFRLRLRAAGHAECWDPLRGEITSIPATRDGERVELSLTLEPYESVLLVFSDEKRDLPRRIEPGGVRPIRTIQVRRKPVPEQPSSVPDMGKEEINPIADCQWVWHPGENAVSAAQPGTRWFRRKLALPPGVPVARARLAVTADNFLAIYINGSRIGSGAGAGNWQQVDTVDLSEQLQPGLNIIGIEATNGASDPNPAGLIGKLTIELADGRTMNVPIDSTWKTTRKEMDGWTSPAFDDSGWADCEVIAAYGEGPWGRLDNKALTLSPILRAEPFAGEFTLPGGLGVSGVRVCLEMDRIEPEAAARVTVNGKDAGGIICAPLRLDITEHLRAGGNTLRIEPFAPEGVRLAVYSN